MKKLLSIYIYVKKVYYYIFILFRMVVMGSKENNAEIILNFIKLLRYFHVNHSGSEHQKKELPFDFEECYFNICKKSIILIDELNEFLSDGRSNLKKLVDELGGGNCDFKEEKIKKIKDKIRLLKLDGSRGDYEYVYLEDELKKYELDLQYFFDLKTKIKDLKSKLIRAEEELKFHKFLYLFSSLVYTSILYFENKITRSEFIALDENINFVDSAAILNLKYLLESFYFGDFGNDSNRSFLKKFICDLLTIDYFMTILIISNDSVKLSNNKYIDYELGKIIRSKEDRRKYRDELRCTEIEFLDLIILQQIVLYILNNLNIKFDDSVERKVAHYTRLDVGFNLVTKASLMRLNSTDFMNDPTEGKILSDFFNLKNIEPENPHSHIFLSCFTFNHNSLNQFRLYGNTNNVECSGMSLVYSSDYFEGALSFFNEDEVFYSKLPLYRCIYMDSFSGYFEVAKRNKFTFFQEYKNKKIASKMWDKYEGKIRKIEEKIDFSFDKMRKVLKLLGENENLKIILTINNILKPLNFLIKHFSFQEEQECRMMRIEEVSDSSVIYDCLNNKSYIEYQVDCDSKIKNIYLGEKAKDNHTHLIKRIIDSGCQLPKIRVSDNPFRSFKENIILDK